LRANTVTDVSRLNPKCPGIPNAKVLQMQHKYQAAFATLDIEQAV
jgi:hypothetical protein